MSPHKTKHATADQPAATSAPRGGRRVSGRAVVALAFLAAVALLLLVAPGALAQPSGNDVAKNLGDLLRGYAAQFYGGVIAIVSLIFLINRRSIPVCSVAALKRRADACVACC